jgi:hypothetical protein
MKSKAFWLLIVLCIFQIIESHWQLPNNHKRLNEITFLAAHNAYANYADGWRYGQQRLTLTKQLDHGVRAFLLDIHLHKNSIVLSHGGTHGLYSLLKKGPFQTLASALLLLQQFIEQNPKEVITIFLENFVDNDHLVQEINNQPNFSSLLLTHIHWNPAEHDNQWPTLKWMQKHNKRIIIFNEDKSHSRPITNNDPFYSIWHHVIESQYGTTNIKCACKQRRESQKLNQCERSLFLLNFFGTFSISKSKRKNSYKILKSYIDKAKKVTDKKPNWLALDFVEQGNGLEIINELNFL